MFKSTILTKYVPKDNHEKIGLNCLRQKQRYEFSALSASNSVLEIKLFAVIAVWLGEGVAHVTRQRASPINWRALLVRSTTTCFNIQFNIDGLG